MGLHWVQVEKTFVEGAEPTDIASALGISEDEAIGKCARLWAWSLDHALPDGRVTGRDPARTIERAIGWNGPPGAFVSALLGIVLELGPNEIRFKGWDDRYGKYLREQEKDAERKRLDRAAGRPDGHPPGRPKRRPTESLSRVDQEPRTKNQDFKNQPPPTPSAAIASASEPPAPPSRAVVGKNSGANWDWVVVDRVRYTADADSSWEMIQDNRVRHRLDRETFRPRTWSTWLQAAIAQVGLGGVFDIHVEFLRDKKIATAGHPTAVFISRGCWEARSHLAIVQGGSG